MQLRKNISRAIAAGSLALALCLPTGISAAELEYPVSCFTDQELAQVRAWEKQWVGSRIDSTNIDQVKEFVPPNLYPLIKDTERWGDTWFSIVSYRQLTPTPGKIAFTKKFNGTAKVGPNNELLDYTAGVPFPKPASAIEMAYNFRTRTLGDGYQSTDRGHIVDGRLQYDMSLRLKNKICFFTARTDTPPVPEFPKNPKQIWRAFTMEQFEPPEVRNQRIMEIQYKDFMKPYDMWFYLPAIRRITRRSTTERQDSTSGSDQCGYDNLGWDGPVRINDYEYLGQKEYLLCRHTDVSKLEHTAGHCIWRNTQRERVRVHLIKVVNKSSNFLYSKMVWYVDPENWNILHAERYDRRGKLWRVCDQLGFVGSGYNGVDISHICGNQTIDVQRKHATLGISDTAYGKQFDQNIFSLHYIQKRSY